MKAIYILLILCLVTIPVAEKTFALEKPLNVEEARVAGVTGMFTLILYGGRHLNDIETVAFLDLEGDRYTFEPYAPEFDYRVVSGVSAKDALAKAEHFVGGHYSFWRSQLNRVLDDRGNVIGYELRPYYQPLAFGLSDVLDVYYAQKGDRVLIYIRLKPLVERQLFQDGDGAKGGGGGD